LIPPAGLDPASGRARLSGSDFTEVVNGVEFPMVPWEELRMAYGFWGGSAGDSEETGFVALAPNPFRDKVRVSLRLAEAGFAHVDVIDAAGREVDRIAERRLPAGESLLEWNGRDRRGHPAASGIYWIRVRCALEDGGERSAVKAAVRLN
jgi:hypothetical protein